MATGHAFSFCGSKPGLFPIQKQGKSMSNIFQKIGVKVSDFGKWVAEAVVETLHVAERVEQILKAEKPLEQPFVSGLSTVIADVEVLIAASDVAVTSDGLNFPADSKVYSDFLTLIDDFKKFAPVVKEAIDALEDKPVTA
jgi:hypothetical protein